VWLVEYHNQSAGHHDLFSRTDEGPISDAEKQRCRTRVATLLREWFTRVVQRTAQPGFQTHANARKPSNHESRVVVDWATSLTQSQVGPRDLVVYFCPWNTGGQGPATAMQPDNPPVTGVLHTPYRDAARGLNIPQLTQWIDRQCGEPNGTSPSSRHGGDTLVNRHSVTGSGICTWPALCQAYIFYLHRDPNGGRYSSNDRADKNADWMAMHAFHEAMHAKDAVTENIDMHGQANVSYAGAAPTPTATGPNQADVDLMARWIWAWCPMYVIGGPFRLYASSYSDYIQDPGAAFGQGGATAD
jgi:hypothetical protein